MPTFAQKLRTLREAANLTQAQLAEVSGLPIGSIRNYEQGQREPLWSVLFPLARALGVSVEEFAECVEEEELPPQRGQSRKPPSSTAAPGGQSPVEPSPAEKPRKAPGKKPKGK